MLLQLRLQSIKILNTNLSDSEIVTNLLKIKEKYKINQSNSDNLDLVLWDSKSDSNYSYILLNPIKRINISAESDMIYLDSFYNIGLEEESQKILNDYFISRETIKPNFIGGYFSSIAYDFSSVIESRLRSISKNKNLSLLQSFIPGTIICRSKNNNKAIKIEFSHHKAHDKIISCDNFNDLIFHQKADTRSYKKPFSYDLKDSREIYEKKINKAKEYILNGDCFQIVLSNKILIKNNIDSLLTYSELKKINPSPYHFYLNYGSNKEIVGASPETYLKNSPPNYKKLYMRLVAGTYARKSNNEEQKEKLLTDKKEIAEHIMLVDHSRNDIGSFSSGNSVEVDRLFEIEEYESLNHIVSQVSGTLSNETQIHDALIKAFPISTLTGTPKVRAMEIIYELEEESRGIFGGSFALLGLDGLLDSCVAIRYALNEKDNNRTVIQVGSGIVYDSLPENEFNECLVKANSLLKSIFI